MKQAESVTTYGSKCSLHWFLCLNVFTANDSGKQELHADLRSFELEKGDSPWWNLSLLSHEGLSP